MMIRVKIKGQRELTRKLAEARRAVIGAVEGALVKAGLLIERDAKRLCPVDTGRLRASISYRLISAGTEVLAVEVGTNVQYAPYVEFGTRPHFPPPEALKRWAKLHGMKPGAEFAIARKIAVEGTPPKPFLFPALNANKSKIERLVIEAVRRELGRK